MPVDTPYFVYYIFHSLCLEALAKALHEQCPSANTSLTKNLYSGLLGTTNNSNTDVCKIIFRITHSTLLRETHVVTSVDWWQTLDDGERLGHAVKSPRPLLEIHATSLWTTLFHRPWQLHVDKEILTVKSSRFMKNSVILLVIFVLKYVASCFVLHKPAPQDGYI